MDRQADPRPPPPLCLPSHCPATVRSHVFQGREHSSGQEAYSEPGLELRSVSLCPPSCKFLFSIRKRLLPPNLITTTSQKPVEIAIHARDDHKVVGAPWSCAITPCTTGLPHPYHSHKPEPKMGRCGLRTRHLSSPITALAPLQTWTPPVTTPSPPQVVKAFWASVSLNPKVHFLALLHSLHNCGRVRQSLVRQTQTHLPDEKQRLPAQARSKALPFCATALQGQTT